MRHRHKGVKNEFTEPDLPITPMLDMSFQLLAFFLTTFNPQPTEGHMDLALPKIEGQQQSVAPPPPLDPNESPEEFTVKVEADTKGDIAQISIAVGKDDAGTPVPGVGRDARKALFDEMKKRLAASKAEGAKRADGKPWAPPKVKLDLSNNTSYKIVVALIDELNRAGYKQVSPALKTETK
jgi:biopolymer transport protein ExbD